MNTREFIKALKGLRDWNTTTEGWIRLSPVIVGQNMDFCPITAVCYDRMKIVYTSAMYGSAASLLGIPKKLADRIAAAADDRPGDSILRHSILRYRLKRALA